MRHNRTVLHTALLILSLAASFPAFSQTYTIQTFAGRGWGAPGLSTSLNYITGVATDLRGNVYMSVYGYSSVVKLDVSGVVTLVAGNGFPGYSGDGGPATLAQLDNPRGLAVDSSGTLYVVDAGNSRVRKIANGIITTVPGIKDAFGLAVDGAGSLYVALAWGGIRKVDDGVISTVAGGGTAFSATGDNVPADGALTDATAIAVDSIGTVYFVDSCYMRIRKVSSGIITTVAGNGTIGLGFLGPLCAKGVAGPDSGRATSVSLDSPWSIAADWVGNVYFEEYGPQSLRIRKVSSGNISTLAGGGSCPMGPLFCPTGDNIPATTAWLTALGSLAVDLLSGSVYLTDGVTALEVRGNLGFNRLRKVSGGLISTVAGAAHAGGDGGPALSAQFNLPLGLSVDASGSLYIADFGNNSIREVTRGVVSTVTATQQFDGVSFEGVYHPLGVAAGPNRALYLAAGSASKLLNGNLTDIPLERPITIAAIAQDISGNLFLADVYSHRIVQVSPAGTVTTVVGNGTPGFSGDGGPATSAQLSTPTGVAIDGKGNLYIADANNQRIRKVSNGIITTVAGNGVPGFSGDNGLGTLAQLNLMPLNCPGFPYSLCLKSGLPVGIAVDATGDLYISDVGNHRVRKVFATNGVITTLAGNGAPDFSGDDGPSTSAQLNLPTGLTVDSAGTVYVADSGNNKIRALTPSCPFSVNPPLVQSSAAGGVVPIDIRTSATCSWNIVGVPSWITLPAALPATGPATVGLTVTANAGPERVATIFIAGRPVVIRQAAGAGSSRVITSVTTVWSGSPAIAPMAWAEIKGSNLSRPGSPPRAWQASAPSYPPTELDGVNVQMNGQPAYVSYVSPSQINVLTPLFFTLGPVEVVVMVDGIASPAFTVQAKALSPALAVFGGGPYVAAVHADGSLVGPPSLYPGLTTPARPGETILLYATGMIAGPLNPPLVKIGGVGAAVLFAGIVPSVAMGLIQLNVIVPPGAADGDHSVSVDVEGIATQPGTLLSVRSGEAK